ncbi:MAG TPA: sugar phosphate isomerase/epimerase family protein [Humisphaera sp.]|jgi:sugar phosphate isomerase/epimerase|nr:sugar phosphate isomerase/epimerase family protein [Humisphaera sp.]
MIKSAVTISLVREARGGPFVFWNDLAEGCAKAAALGFDAVEIFPPGAEAVRADIVKPLLEKNRLSLAAVGTGAGWVAHRLTLTSAVAAERQRARDFVRSIIDAAAVFKAPAIIGSMQGRWSSEVDCDTAMKHLRDALNELGEHAGQQGVPLFYEPLNRYETNLINQQSEGVAMVRSLESQNVKLLCDLFHMSIEEANLAATLRAVGKSVGHVHFADSNRRPVGGGHTDFVPIVQALADIGYDGYISAECFPFPDPDAAAEMTIRSFKKYFRNLNP